MRVPCRWCGGSGRRIGQRRRMVTCKDCKGKGWFEEGVFIDEPHDPRHYDGIRAPDLDAQEAGRITPDLNLDNPED